MTSFRRSEILAALRDQVTVAVERAQRMQRPVLVSHSFALCAPTDLVDRLARFRVAGEETFLWERRSDGLSMAGVGRSWCATASGTERFRQVAAAREALVVDAIRSPAGAGRGYGPIFFGAFSFDPQMRPDGPWHGLPSARLILPRLLIVQRDEESVFTLCGVAVPGETGEALVLQLAHALDGILRPAGDDTGARHDPSGIPTSGYAGTDVPSEDAWMESVSRTIDDIARSRIEKLVLTRSCSIRAAGRLDCARAFDRLRRAYPSCATFWVGTAGADFVGATPETLAALEGRSLKTSAVAGSADRGVTVEEDDGLREALIGSQKDRHEHEIVVRAIATVLRPLCDRLRVASEPEVLQLANVQHLLTPIRGLLGEKHGLLDLVERLHPTPAVAGFPPQEALAELRSRERVDRGWYAGPIGWIDADGNGEFSVAIRSALVRGGEALLYAGAGIVAGSDPEKELEETRMKLRPLISALTDAPTSDTEEGTGDPSGVALAAGASSA